ncbi:MAG: GAF domain-containing protein [Rhodospirillaceae bacterium]|nr:GAF domain-containing protein [Rhodospirillales bacterium]
MIAHNVADQLRLIDRAVTTLTRSTEALLRATDEAALLEDICRIAVDVAGYRLAWVGYARPDEMKSVRPVAIAGRGQSYVQEISVSWADSELGQGPIGTAIRTGRPQVVHDTAQDPRFAPWRDAAARHHFRSVLSLPLGQGHDRIGTLNIYASEREAFDADVVRLLEDMARNLTYGIGALRMKAEHEQAVRDLAESEERYRSLIDLTPDAIIVHSQGTVLFANAASAKVFAAGQIDLLGRRVLDLIHDDFQVEVAQRIANPPTQRHIFEYRMMRMDGSEFEAEVAATTITFHGLAARILVIRDVTDRKQVQQQLVQATKLATLGEMAAGLVHELSQPLNIIRLTAEGALLFIERGKATQEFQSQQFQLVADQAQRTAEIIDDIRIFSRRDTSPVQVFDAAAAVASALGVLEGQLRTDDIILTTDLPDLAVLVRGRRVQLEQVVMNLLSNAQHALKERRDVAGEDSIWHAEITVSAKRHGRNLIITVADSGPGIPPAVRARIFEPFFTTKEAGRGTGLGLSVSFSIISSMGGCLEVVDQSGGACFAITLPVDEDSTLTVGDDKDTVPEAAAMDSHIMVVEDEPTAGATLGRYLNELGYRVTVCANGNEAWKVFCTDPADVVITDLRMPAGGGEQLVEKLRDFDPLMPIVIVTGHLGATERLAENLNDDRCAVLKKPIPLGKLAEIIATFLKPPAEEDA